MSTVMDTLRRSPALNPSSTPFFPGGMRVGEEDDRHSGIGFRLLTNRDQQGVSTSSLSISPTDYRSVRSSPSPPHGGHANDRQADSGLHFTSSQELPRRSPALRQFDNDRAFPISQQQSLRESSSSGSVDTTPDGEDTPGPHTLNGQLAPGASFYGAMLTRGRHNTPPVVLDNGSRSSFHTTHFASSSPASSLDSGSHFATNLEVSSSFEAQLKASPFMREITDRLSRCEMTTRELQRVLGDVNRKIDFLVEQSGNSNARPEFKDPFAPSPVPPQSFSGVSLNAHRPSFGGNIAPNQTPSADEMTLISQRLNTLTSSVGQLVAIQSQQYQTSGSQMLGHGPQQGDIAPNQLIPTPNATMLGHGMPNRPDVRPNPRMPNPPMRTWSAGTLDFLRSSDTQAGPVSRQDVLRDKRRSVTGLLRRESAGGDSLSSTSSRDGGPVVTKWEQLTLAPDLLRSLSSFGVGPPNKIQQRALPFLLRGADIIAQAPPTQERIAAYVIPAIHIALSNSVAPIPPRGPLVIIISTTVDQATQAQRMIRDLGGPIGVRSALGVGSASGSNELMQELRLLQQNMPHIICGTPQKLHALFTSPGGISGSEVRFLVLDEVDQLIARNLHESVFAIVKLLPSPRSRPLSANAFTQGIPGNGSQTSFTSFESNGTSSLAPFQPMQRSLSGLGTSHPTDAPNGLNHPIERQTALFSNTVPQDVLNLASAIQLREPVRVLVRRDGNVTHADTSQGARGLRQFYLYLAFTASGRSDVPLPSGGLGIIGSGRGASSAETAQAREWKLDALVDLFDDLDVPQAIIHVGGLNALEAVIYKLSSRGLDVVPLHGDMSSASKIAALNKFRGTAPSMVRPQMTKILVVYDVQVKTPEVPQIPLIINYDLPKAVEEYAHRVAPAIAPSYSRAGVIVNFVTATGGDVEMLRSIECFYKIKCPEVPMSLRDIV